MKSSLLLVFSLSALAVFSQDKKNATYLDYIEKYKDIAVEQMRTYKIPASITLAQGILESGAGRSALALRSNNHFGIKCGSSWKGKTTKHDDDKMNALEYMLLRRSLILTTLSFCLNHAIPHSSSLIRLIIRDGRADSKLVATLQVRYMPRNSSNS